MFELNSCAPCPGSYSYAPCPGSYSHPCPDSSSLSSKPHSNALSLGSHSNALSSGSDLYVLTLESDSPVLSSESDFCIPELESHFFSLMPSSIQMFADPSAPSPEPLPTVSSRTPTSINRKGDRKRKNSDDNGGSDREPKRRRKFLSPPAVADDRNKFVCPYRKSNPRKYRSTNKQWRSCALTPLENIARVSLCSSDNIRITVRITAYRNQGPLVQASYGISLLTVQRDLQEPGGSRPSP
jgi:hypothetical protein